MAAYNYWNTPQDPMQWPRTFQTSFQETIVRDLKNTTQLESFQSICFQPEFQQYSPEELRLADCYIRGLISQKVSHTDPTPCFAPTLYTPTWVASTPPRPRRLSLSPPTKPRVRVPIIAADGTANMNSVIQIQDQLERANKELAEVKQRLEKEKDEAVEAAKHELRSQSTGERRKLVDQANQKIADMEQAVAAAESKMKIDMDKTLQLIEMAAKNDPTQSVGDVLTEAKLSSALAPAPLSFNFQSQGQDVDARSRSIFNSPQSVVPLNLSLDSSAFPIFGPPLERARPIFGSGGGNSLQPTFAFGRPSFPVAGEKREREAGDVGGEVEKFEESQRQRDRCAEVRQGDIMVCLQMADVTQLLMGWLACCLGCLIWHNGITVKYVFDLEET